jgi:hypothetical protein
VTVPGLAFRCSVRVTQVAALAVVALVPLTSPRSAIEWPSDDRVLEAVRAAARFETDGDIESTFDRALLSLERELVFDMSPAPFERAMRDFANECAASFTSSHEQVATGSFMLTKLFEYGMGSVATDPSPEDRHEIVLGYALFDPARPLDLAASVWRMAMSPNESERRPALAAVRARVARRMSKPGTRFESDRALRDDWLARACSLERLCDRATCSRSEVARLRSWFLLGGDPAALQASTGTLDWDGILSESARLDKPLSRSSTCGSQFAATLLTMASRLATPETMSRLILAFEVPPDVAVLLLRRGQGDGEPGTPAERIAKLESCFGDEGAARWVAATDATELPVDVLPFPVTEGQCHLTGSEAWYAWFVCSRYPLLREAAGRWLAALACDPEMSEYTMHECRKVMREFPELGRVEPSSTRHTLHHVQALDLSSGLGMGRLALSVDWASCAARQRYVPRLSLEEGLELLRANEGNSIVLPYLVRLIDLGVEANRRSVLRVLPRWEVSARLEVAAAALGGR